MGFKKRIAALRSEKTVKERVFDMLDQFSEAEESEVRNILIDLLDIKDAKIEKKEYKFAKAAKPVAVASDAPKKRGRKPGSKNKVKVADGVVDAAAAPKASAAGRGRVGKFPKIHEEETRNAIIKVMRDANDTQTPNEIRAALYDNGYEAQRSNKSFQTRLATIIKGMVNDGIISKDSRGVYKLIQK